MVSGHSDAVVAHRRGIVSRDDLEVMPDEELLAQFLEGAAGAEAAFRVLVVRHGPMVLGVCRNVLHELHDAEDAFQATFLVLARKAGTIRDGRVLGRWLYEVAYRIAVRARAHSVRRRSKERQGAEMSAIAPEHDPDWTDLQPVLHEEVSRLPEKYRTPVVLCYLEGKTNEEVARLLDWPVGTVKGRLSRARDLLRTRLSRRGVALSAAFIGVFLSQKRLMAEDIPASLVDSTVRTAMEVAAQKLSGAAHSTSGRAGSLKAKPSRTYLRILVLLVTLTALGYTVTGLAMHESQKDPEDRSALGSFLLQTMNAGQGGGGGCGSKPAPALTPAGTLPRRTRPLG